jgi:hypothetical protein
MDMWIHMLDINKEKVKNGNGRNEFPQSKHMTEKGRSYT